MIVLKIWKWPDMVTELISKYSNKSNKGSPYDVFVYCFWFFLACLEQKGYKYLDAFRPRI